MSTPNPTAILPGDPKSSGVTDEALVQMFQCSMDWDRTEFAVRILLKALRSASKMATGTFAEILTGLANEVEYCSVILTDYHGKHNDIARHFGVPVGEPMFTKAGAP